MADQHRPIDHHHRNAVLRAYINGRDWGDNPEFDLVRQLVAEPPPELQEYPFLVAHEWEASPGATNHGVGDLVFSDGDSRFAVVEVKWIDVGTSGHTARTKRRKKRRDVELQACWYARLWIRRWPGTEVVGFAFTNEWGLVPMGAPDPTE